MSRAREVVSQHCEWRGNDHHLYLTLTAAAKNAQAVPIEVTSHPTGGACRLSDARP